MSTVDFQSFNRRVAIFSLETFSWCFNFVAPLCVSLVHGSLSSTGCQTLALAVELTMRRGGIVEKGVQAERWALHLGYIKGLRDYVPLSVCQGTC